MKNIDKKLDDVFAIWIKLKYTNDEGWGQCYTCATPKPLHYKNMDCGHYPQIPREHHQFKWNAECKLHRPQCVDCNRFKHGLAEPFRDRLVSELGFEAVSKMEFDSRKPFKDLGRWDKETLFKKLKKECQEMLKEKMFSISLP